MKYLKFYEEVKTTFNPGDIIQHKFLKRKNKDILIYKVIKYLPPVSSPPAQYEVENIDTKKIVFIDGRNYEKLTPDEVEKHYINRNINKYNV